MALVLRADRASGQSFGQLTGWVKGDTGLPVAEAAVTLRGVAERSTQTSADGAFEFRDVPEGDYELTASRAGFVTTRQKLRVVGGASLSARLTMTVALLEQVVVTAARLGETDVQDTPLAVSALRSEELARTTTHNVEQLAGLAPSVTFSQNTGFAQLTIRGIGTNVVFAGSDPSSAVYVDGVYLARPAMVLADFLDLERVEVLRGPQGTLYGRNALGGAINVITKPPSNEFETSVDVVAGTYDTFRAEARVSGPMLGNRITGSGAFLRSVRRGFVQDLQHLDNPLGGEDVVAGRGQMRVAIGRRSDLLFAADVNYQEPTPLTYAKVLAVKPGFVVDNPQGLHRVRMSTPPESQNVQGGLSGRVAVSLTPRTTLTSLTAFRAIDYELVNDADITELPLVISHVHEKQHQVSEELTVAHKRPGLTWIGGLFLFDESDRQPTIVTLEGPRLENFLNPRVDASTAALFGQATLDIMAHTAVTAGLRYSDERKTILNEGRLATIDVPITVQAGTEYKYVDSLSDGAWTPKFGLEWRPRSQVVAYVSATRGFKSGGFNLSSTEPGRGYAPEWAWSYEGGVKSTISGRAKLNVAVFNTDYTNLQVQTPIRPGVLDISNAAAATIRGLEIEAVGGLAKGVQAGGHVAWLNTRYDRYIAVGVDGVTGDVSGNQLSNAPEGSGRVWLEWNHDIGARSLSIRADTRWQTTVYFSPFNDAIQRQSPYGLLDVSAKYGPRRARWSLGAYVRNLTNEGYITGTFISPPPAIGGRPGELRTFGAQLNFRP